MSFRPGSSTRSARVAHLDDSAAATATAAEGDAASTAPLPSMRDSEDSPLSRARRAFADQLLSDLRAQPVESRLAFVSREISLVQALSSALVEEAQKLQVARHSELTKLMAGPSTVASTAAASARHSSYSIQLAPLSLPRTLPLWDTVCSRVFGPKIALRMHLSVGGLGGWMNAQDTVFVLCAITLALLVLFDVVPRSLSWLSFACFLASFLTAPLHCNWPIVLSVLHTFDFWFLLAHILFAFFFLLPDLCAWDQRAVIWFGWGAVGFTGLLADAAPTKDSMQGYMLSWGGVILSMLTIGVSVEKRLFADLYPRTIDFGITRMPTQGATISTFGTVIVWGLKFIVSAIVSPGRGLLLKVPVQRSDLAHDVAATTKEGQQQQEHVPSVAVELAEGPQQAGRHPIGVAWSNSHPQPLLTDRHSDAVVALSVTTH